jgi:tetratricopeptide (TPR) repeat protein
MLAGDRRTKGWGVAADESRRSIEAARRLEAAVITGQGVVPALTWASCQIPAFRAVLFLAAVQDRTEDSADWVVASLIAHAAEHSGEEEKLPADAAEALVRLALGQQEVELPARDGVSYSAVALQVLDVILEDWVPTSVAMGRLLEQATAEQGLAGLSPAEARAWRLVADDGGLPDREPAAEDIELALANYTSVATRDPTAGWAISGRAELYQMAGRAAEALADYDQIVNSVPNPGWAMCRRAEIFRDLGQHEQRLPSASMG